MIEDYEGVYLPTSDPDVYESTRLANAGWYEEGQHGGALAALIAGHVEPTPTLASMEIARISVELFRVVPLVPLRIESKVVREGKKIQTITAEVTDPKGTALASAVVHRLRRADVPLDPGSEPPPLTLSPPGKLAPVDLSDWGVGEAEKAMFHRQAVDVREIYGGFNTPGPGAIWLRLTLPIIAGRPITPVQRAVTVADFCNGVSRSLGQGWIFMNSDLTVHLGRYPDSEWVALEAEAHYSDLGRGVAAGLLWDERGWIGRSAQTLFLDKPRNSPIRDSRFGDN